MSTQNRPGPAFHDILPPLAHRSAECAPVTQSALEESSRHAARMAIARWTNGARHAQMQVNAALCQSARARWYAQAQRDFQEWIARGGFAQSDDPNPVEHPGAGATPVSREDDAYNNWCAFF